ncbi:3-phosphoshikimate 1-carboxyvinyltransferase [Lacticaseibacillus baoqingensis]|uniref:3-phosphoshikimate 1-carboxyvinyltransferase n=1 Tax=Lacticaseibacillus baoqingensis TaxID=2486013 RepID=A0ABW4E766_9LACO|nr:3-phosphoshikimate 1-carboxyvinyltransferase [Lacticaseibacillus baoqingensis]
MTVLTAAPATGLHGHVRVPGDKSISHRALMLGALAKGTTTITNFLSSADCLSTLEALRALGVPITYTEQQVTVHGGGRLKPAHVALNMNNAGTATRLLMGLLAAQPFTSCLVGDASLSKRPMRRVSQPLAAMGAAIDLDAGHLPAVITGRPLKAIDYTLPVASAQVKSAILLAGLQAAGTTIVREALPTRDHTERMLKAFGVRLTVSADRQTIALPGGQPLIATPVAVPGDMSSAAFFIAAATIVPNSHIRLPQVGINPTRTGFLQIVRRMGGNIKVTPLESAGEPLADLEVTDTKLQPIDLAAADIPAVIDELPLVALLAAHANGVSHIHGAEELRVKETDRIQTIVSELRKLGVAIEAYADGFVIDGRKTSPITDAHVDSHGDHRIAMMLAVAALVADAPLELHDAAAMTVSYPDFLTDLERLCKGDLR